MIFNKAKLQTLQVFKKLSFGMLMLWQVKSIGISPLQYPSTLDNLKNEIKLTMRSNNTTDKTKPGNPNANNEVIPVTMPLWWTSAVTQVGFVCHLTFQADKRFGQVDLGVLDKWIRKQWKKNKESQVSYTHHIPCHSANFEDPPMPFASTASFSKNML
jgi:hypothetical protein